MYRYQVIGFLLWSMLCGAVGAQTTPEECLRPANWADRTVCTDNDLLSLHVQLQRAYNDRRAQLEGDAFMDLVSYQHGWMRGREECRTAPDSAGQLSCLKDLYQARLMQLSGKLAATPPPPSPAPAEGPRAAPDPTLLACRGEGPNWVMELGAQSARLRIGTDMPVQGLKGRMTTSQKARTSAWRGRESVSAADTVLILMEGACQVDGSAARFALMGRLSLPDGSLLSGCCQRTPVSVMIEPGSAETDIPEAARAAGAGALLAVGSQVRLRDVDGPNVALRKSARISSGNILQRVRAGSVAVVEQAALREGISWYFVAIGAETKGWVMGELVEPLVAVAVKGGSGVAANVELPPLPPSSPVRPPVTPDPEPQERQERPSSRAGGFDGPLAKVGRQWWSNLTQQLPVIDACIERARLRTARIVKVTAEGPFTRHVYARDGLKNRIMCVVRSNEPVRARVLDRDEPFPQTEGPLFTRAPGEPPSASCYRNQRAMERGTRKPAGWLSYVKPGRRCK